MSKKLDYYDRHNDEMIWEDGEYTVYRNNVWSGPGCHDGCGVLYYVKDGKLAKVEGDPRDPYNQGTLCMRCLDMPEAVNSPHRAKTPLKRAGERGENKWEEITWDEAYDIIEAKVRAIWKDYSPLSIAAHIGTGRNNCWQVPYLCYAGFGSPNFSLGYLSGDSCFLPRAAAMGAMQGDFLIADCSQQFASRYDEVNTEWRCPEVIVIWGNNPIISNSDNFYGHWIVECMQRGSKLIVIDPACTWLASRAEVWLPIRPGTDTAMALGWANVIIQEELYDKDFVDAWTFGFDEFAERCTEYDVDRVAEITWCDAEDIRRAARLYAAAKPATIQWGLPIDQCCNGIESAQAVNALWTITGNVDIPGGNIIIRNAFEQNLSYNYGYHELTEEVREQRLGGDFPLKSKAGFSSTAQSDSILKAIETGEPYPIRMVWMTSTNPIANMASGAPRVYDALRSVDFVVVNDLFVTPTAVAFADIFLPAAMSCERDQQRPWWVPLRMMYKVTEYGECRSDEDTVLGLGRRLNPDLFPWKDAKEWNDFILKYETKGMPTTDWDELCHMSQIYPDFVYRKHEKGLLRPDGKPGFNTQTGRIELYETVFAIWGYDPLPYFEEPSCSPVASPELYEQYPFVLTTGHRSFEFFHSEHRQLETMREFHPDPLFEMNDKAAEELGLVEGDWCWLENQRGRCRERLHINASLNERYIRAEHGWWFPESEGAEPHLFGVFDSNINNLTTQCENGPMGYGAPYKQQLCKVYKCTEENSADMPSYVVTRGGGF